MFAIQKVFTKLILYIENILMAVRYCTILYAPFVYLNIVYGHDLLCTSTNQCTKFQNYRSFKMLLSTFKFDENKQKRNKIPGLVEELGIKCFPCRLKTCQFCNLCTCLNLDGVNGDNFLSPRESVMGTILPW